MPTLEKPPEAKADQGKGNPGSEESHNPKQSFRPNSTSSRSYTYSGNVDRRKPVESGGSWPSRDFGHFGP